MINNYLTFVMEGIVNFRHVLALDTIDVRTSVTLRKVAGGKKMRWSRNTF